MNRKKIISIKISTGKYSDFVDEIIKLTLSRHSAYACVANVHMLIEAYKDKSFAEIVNNADIVTPDGMPLALGIKWLYGIRQDRVAGMDLLPDLLSECEKQNIGVFFYGGTQQMLSLTLDYLKSNHSNLNVCGVYSPPFRPLTEVEEIEIIKKINDVGAALVFVVLGCPKQEKWMANMKGRIKGTMIGVGGALPVMVGIRKRAPVYIQNMGFEWLYRLLQEPKRLFKRYLFTNALFLILFQRELLKKIIAMLFGRKMQDEI